MSIKLSEDSYLDNKARRIDLYKVTDIHGREHTIESKVVKGGSNAQILLRNNLKQLFGTDG